MPLWTDVVTPAELTGYIRAGIEDNPQNRVSLDVFLPNDEVQDIVARLLSGDQGMADAAKFRSYDAEHAIGSRGGGARSTLELPPLGRKVRVSEYDQLRARNADSDEQVRAALEKEALRQARATIDRMELARGDALLDGKVTINENGFIAEADYGRSGLHTATASTLWSNGAATPYADLESWAATYEASTGSRPGSVLMSRRAFSVLRGKLAGPAATTNLVSREAVQNAFDDLGLGQVFIYDRSVKVDGVMTRVLPDDRVILLPAPVDPTNADGTDLGATVWGRTLEAMDPRYELPLDNQPGIVAGAYKDDDPVGAWVKAAAIGLPVLANPDLSFVADVF